MAIIRRNSRVIQIGAVSIGGTSPIALQSMTTTLTKDVTATVRQINELTVAGCTIVRVAVPDEVSADAIREIKQHVQIPVVADIHFDYRLALRALDAGADKIRINPGNIGSTERVIKIIEKAKALNIPIRIGSNAGSVRKEANETVSQSMVRAIREHIALFEKHHFTNIVLSLKAPEIETTVEAYRELADECDYPFHLGITHAGTDFSGSIASAIGIGILLYQGIGDTIRVSLSDDPLKEIRTGKMILKSLGLKPGVRVISCPTCARVKLDVIKISRELEAATEGMNQNLSVAVMGCEVNGPGEVRTADFGVLGGLGGQIGIFHKGKFLGQVKESDVVPRIVEEIQGSTPPTNYESKRNYE